MGVDVELNNVNSLPCHPWHRVTNYVFKKLTEVGT